MGAGERVGVRVRVGVSIGPSAERVALEGNDLGGNAEAEVRDERKPIHR